MRFDTLYQEFLEELQDLENFRVNYLLDNPNSGLDGDDPYVKRIIEALAFFCARTQTAALHSLDSSTKRLYQQFFSYLLTPLAGMAIASAEPNGHLTEVLDISAETELSLQPDIGGNIMFCTRRSLRILPMRLPTVKQELIDEKKGRILMIYEANYPLNEKLGLISLHTFLTIHLIKLVFNSIYMMQIYRLLIVNLV